MMSRVFVSIYLLCLPVKLTTARRAVFASSSLAQGRHCLSLVAEFFAVW